MANECGMPCKYLGAVITVLLYTDAGVSFHCRMVQLVYVMYVLLWLICLVGDMRLGKITTIEPFLLKIHKSSLTVHAPGTW